MSGRGRERPFNVYMHHLAHIDDSSGTMLQSLEQRERDERACCNNNDYNGILWQQIPSKHRRREDSGTGSIRLNRAYLWNFIKVVIDNTKLSPVSQPPQTSTFFNLVSRTLPAAAELLLFRFFGSMRNFNFFPTEVFLRVSQFSLSSILFEV